jgi:hypothetical protein
MAPKSDRLKKLESELTDLEEWKRLGLVPKKDLKKHETEILSLREKISEEHDRLDFIKENGEAEEYVSPKKNVSRQAGYINMPTLPDVDIDDGGSPASRSRTSDASTHTTVSTEAETVSDVDQETSTAETTVSEATSSVTEHTESDDDPFSDANRWRRGIADPDEEDNW